MASSTCALPRTLVEKLYHSSERAQRVPSRCFVDGWALSSMMISPGRPAGGFVAACPGISEPTRLSHQAKLPRMSVALWIAAMPLPDSW
jgi:hypothetical protein